MLSSSRCLPTFFLTLFLLLKGFSSSASFRVFEIGLYEAPHTQVDADKAYTAWQAGKYGLYHSPSFNLGITHNRYWLHFSVESNGAEHLIAVLSNPFIYQTRLYRIKNKATTFMYGCGANVPFNQRPVKSRLLAFPLEPITGKTEYLLLLDRRQEVLRFTFEVLPSSEFVEKEAHNYLFFGAVGGILLFILLFSCLLAVLLNDQIYAWYASYILLMFLFIAADNGFGFELFWPDWPYVQKNIRSWLGPAAFGAQVYFMYLFLGKYVLSHSFKMLVHIHLGFSALLVLLALLPAAHSSAAVLLHQILSFVYYIGGVAMILIQCWILAIQRNRSAQLYLFSIFPVGILIVFVMLSRFSIITFNLETARLYAIAIVMEITILAFGLARRYRLLKRHKDKLEYELISQQKENFSNVLIAQDNERKRIAEDLHDDLGGALSAIKALISSANDNRLLQQAGLMLDETSEKLRYIAHNLMPAGFAKVSLSASLEESVHKANTQKQAAFQFICYGNALPLTKDTELNILRMANELIHNIIKHAHATEATVQLIYHQQHLELIIEDNGTGIPAKGKSHQNGIGLRNVSSRAAYIGATIFCDSNNHGTTIICKIPA